MGGWGGRELPAPAPPAQLLVACAVRGAARPALGGAGGCLGNSSGLMLPPGAQPGAWRCWVWHAADGVRSERAHRKHERGIDDQRHTCTTSRRATQATAAREHRANICALHRGAPPAPQDHFRGPQLDSRHLLLLRSADCRLLVTEEEGGDQIRVCRQCECAGSGSGEDAGGRRPNALEICAVRCSSGRTRKTRAAPEPQPRFGIKRSEKFRRSF